VYDVLSCVDKVQFNCTARILNIALIGEAFELIQKIKSFNPSILIGFPKPIDWPKQYKYFSTSVLINSSPEKTCCHAFRNDRHDIKQYVTLSIDKKASLQDFFILTKDVDLLNIYDVEDRHIFDVKLPSISTLKQPQNENTVLNYLTQKGALPYCTNLQY